MPLAAPLATHRATGIDRNRASSAQGQPRCRIVSRRGRIQAHLGLGQFYNGETLKGICIFLAFMAVSFDIVIVPYRQAVFFGIWIAGIAEAFWSARRINHFSRSFSGTSYLLYAMLAVYALIVGLFLYTGQPDVAYLARLFPPVALRGFFPL